MCVCVCVLLAGQLRHLCYYHPVKLPPHHMPRYIYIYLYVYIYIYRLCHNILKYHSLRNHDHVFPRNMVCGIHFSRSKQFCPSTLGTGGTVFIEAIFFTLSVDPNAV